MSHSLTRLFSVLLWRFAAVVAAVAAFCEPISAQDAAVGDTVAVDALSLGFNGVGRVGNWLPVRLKVHGLAASREVVLTVIASDPRGDQCESKVATSTSDAAGVLDIHGVFMTGGSTAPCGFASKMSKEKSCGSIWFPAEQPGFKKARKSRMRKKPLQSFRS